ncbi:MAG: ATPase [Cellvibrionaceae bacterium]|nr:ATPase [Cellvibrionaceae bacterium]|tara:strand:- start:7234 stop:8838 length:1605 start_codon:yes stop_codon:yes gene_type:complete
MTAKENSLPKTNQFSELKELIAESEQGLKKRITALIEQVGAGLYEREEVIAIAFLGVVSGQNTFFFGPPGTAKSLISRRLATAFSEPAYFEHLMSRFTTPEEVFGPVSIKELKEDRYIRKTNGYLPTADFAFLDEIWKSSPAILNTLLTLINEHIFKNGENVEDVPLKGLIAASNEVPAENQGLEALYDRFVVRLVVPPVSETANFKALISSKPSESKPQVDKNLLVQYDELDGWKSDIHDVAISDSCMQIIQLIREELGNQFEELGVYVSDRRWQRAVYFMKASAFFNGRKSTSHSDAILLKYCLWTTPENRESVDQLVLNAIKSSGIASAVDIAALDLKKEELDKEIEKELYHSQDVYKTVKLVGNKQYFKCTARFRNSQSYYRDDKDIQCFIPYKEFKSQEKHRPVDQSGNPLRNMTVGFKSQGSCEISHEEYRDKHTFTPTVLFHKGDKKEEVNERLIKSLLGSIGDLRGQLRKALKDIEGEFSQYKQYLNSPFINSTDVEVAVSGIKDQIDEIKLRIQDCERLESLCRQ